MNIPRTRKRRPAAAGKAWLREEGLAARRAAGPAIGLGLLNVAGGVGQCWAIAMLLGRRPAGLIWAAVFAVLAAERAVVQLVAEKASLEAGLQARGRLRRAVMERVLDAGPALLRRVSSAALAGAAVDQVDALEPWFARWVPVSVLAMAAPCVVLAGALVADWRAALVLLGCGLLVPAGMAVAGIGAAAASRQQFAAMARLQARFLDRVRGIATIVSLGRVGDEAVGLRTAADELRRRTMRVLRVAFLSSALLDCAAAVAIVVIAVRYAGLGGVTARGLFLLLLVPEFFAPLRAYAAAYQDGVHAATAAGAIAALPEVAVRPAVAVRTVAAHGVSVAFEGVTAVWDPARGPALDGVSFRVAAGETLVLAGPSGSGKSTVIELLLGFLAPAKGRVMLNGVDVATITPAALARLTAWVGQRPLLFAASVRENIRFGRPEASGAEVDEAARRARVVEFAEGLPLGLDTVIGEGGYGLSGGQAQRVAIARAYLRNAPLLLLDEPTAHLDPATEQDVLESLKRLTLGRTTILASHSAAAHAFAGRRLDLRDGRVVVGRAQGAA